MKIPKIPLGDWVEYIVNFVVNNCSYPLDVFSEFIGSMISTFESILLQGYPVGHLLLLLVLTGIMIEKRRDVKTALKVISGIGGSYTDNGA